jgi:hypothetical protein
MTNTYKANRDLLNRLKVEAGCSICGYNAHPFALQLDHIDPSTKYRNKNGKLVNPAQLVNYSQAVLLAEFLKCRVLCANCHMIYTHTEQKV